MFYALSLFLNLYCLMQGWENDDANVQGHNRKPGLHSHYDGGGQAAMGTEAWEWGEVERSCVLSRSG
jgi:hypothetical protein